MLLCDSNKKDLKREVSAPEILTKEKALQTLIVSWDDAEIAEYFIK